MALTPSGLESELVAAIQDHTEGEPLTPYQITQVLLNVASKLGLNPVGATPWRTGGQIDRNIYDANNLPIGSMDTGFLSHMVVQAVNNAAE